MDIYLAPLPLNELSIVGWALMIIIAIAIAGTAYGLIAAFCKIFGGEDDY